MARQAPSLDAYGPGGFRVSGLWRPGSLLILQDEPRDWRPHSLSDLAAEDFAEVLAAGAEASDFVLLGTGAEQGLPPPAVRAVLREASLGLEFMSTPNAARTWSVLREQGRRVALAMLAL